MKNAFRPRTLGLLIILLVLAALSYGFAASITVTAPDIGEGENTALTDFDADVDWILNSTDPTSDPYACVTFSNGVTTVNSAYMMVRDGTSTDLLASWAVGDVDGTYTQCAGSYHAQFDLTLSGAYTIADIYEIAVAAGE